MIFFTKKIEPFKAEKGMQVSPIPCELTDNRTGFFLGDEWTTEIEAKGGEVETITKEDLKKDEII